MDNSTLVKEAPPSYNDVAGPNAAYPPTYTTGVDAYPKHGGYPQGAYPQQPQGAYPQQPQGPYPASTYHQQTANVVLVSQPLPRTTTVSGIKPNNYLAMSLFSLFCCCWLFGLIALMYSLQVDSSWSQGDTQRAHVNSVSAKRWNVISIVTGIVFAVVIVVASGTRFLYAPTY